MKHKIWVPVVVGAMAFLVSPAALSLGGEKPASPPDLTKPGTYTDTTNTRNLGPTGCRGWMYGEGNDWMFEPEKLTTKSRQILITHVEPGSPAWGVLQTNDVILGIGSSLFTNDARKSFGWAIGEAEKAENGGLLKLKVWRPFDKAQGKQGVTTDNVTVKLEIMGAYSQTAPYDCPKSAKILSNACKYMAAHPVDNGSTEGSAVIGMALLAAGRDEDLARVQAYARKIAPQNLKVTIPDCGMVAWPWGYQNLFLSEYYQATGDTNVLHAIREYSANIARGQSVFGTYGHGMAMPKSDGSSIHGYVPWYGALNQAGLVCNLSMAVAKKCGLKDPELDQAIERGSRFFGRYAGQGTIPYGEGNAEELHEDNGKTATAALLLALQDQRDMTWQAQWFAKMCTAGYALREFGHTGPGFCHLWQGLGANLGGPKAMAAYFKQIQWHYDLLRRWDGSFTYDSAGGGSPGNEYLGKNSSTAFYMLTYSTPLRKLYITGKKPNKAIWLGGKDVDEAIADGRYTLALDIKAMTTAELVASLGSWSPQKRQGAANELGNRTHDHAAVFPELLKMAEGKDAKARIGACTALGLIKDARAVPVFIRCLSDRDAQVRFVAAKGLEKIGPGARPELNNMLTMVVKNARPIEPLDWFDPAQVAYGALGSAVFRGQLASSSAGVDTNLLYSSIDSMSRSYHRSVLSDLFQGGVLSSNDVKALAPVLCRIVTTSHEIWDGGSPQAVLKLLSRYNVEEGIAAAMQYRNSERGRDWFPSGTSMEVLRKYRSAAKSTLPELRKLNPKGNETIAVIENDTNPPPALLCFKTIHSVSVTPAVIVAPASTATLSASASDIDGGSLTYTWSKVRGRGPVTFSPNGTAASSNCVAMFTIPGPYILQLTVADASLGDGATGYGGVRTNLLVSFGNVVNQPPVADSQAVTLAEDTSAAITLTAKDPEGYELVYTRTASPAHGTLSGALPNLTYTPVKNWHGEDSFTFTVMDSDGTVSVPATVKIVVTHVNHPPVAYYRSLPVSLNTAADIQLSASDIDGDALTFTLLSQPENGTLSGTAPKLTYTPSNGFKGVDHFTFKVNDGQVDSEPAKVTITLCNLTNGVNSEFYQWVGLKSPEPWPDMASRKPDTTRIDAKMQIGNKEFPQDFEDHFCSRHNAYIKIDKEGDYTFISSGDDNTKVWVDEKLVCVQIYQVYGPNLAGNSGPLHLTPGYHAVRLEFMETYGNNYFNLFWSGPGFGQQIIPAEVFFRRL